MTDHDIEKLEEKYLKKYFHFLKFAEDEMMEGFRTKEIIKGDWIRFWEEKEISDFAVGAERIVYALLNGKGIGQPNSSPVGSDLFFEVPDAYIHIDMKTVQSDNITDFAESIFVGENQNSYKGTIVKQNASQDYNPCLPQFYHPVNKAEKVCLTYFVSILYDKETLDILVISVLCMPNGALENIYKSRPLKAGKNPGKARFNFSKTPYFETFSDPKNHPRVKVVYFNPNMKEEYKKRLTFYEGIYKQQVDGD